MIHTESTVQIPAASVHLIDPDELANHAATLESYVVGAKTKTFVELSSELAARVLTLKKIPEFEPATKFPSDHFIRSLKNLCQLLYKLKVPLLWANNRLLPWLKIEWAILDSDETPQSFLVETVHRASSHPCGYIGPVDGEWGLRINSTADIINGFLTNFSFDLVNVTSVEVASLLHLLEYTICRYHWEPETRRILLKAMQKICANPMAFPRPFNLLNVQCTDQELIGKGGFSDVYKGTLNSTQIVCLKVPRMCFNPDPSIRHKEASKAMRSFINEAVIWKLLQHPNVLPFLGVSYNCFSSQVCFVSPFMRNGDVNKFLGQEKKSIEDRVWILLDAANGLKYLHSLDITHGDIKGANILVNDQGRACLSDLGIASITTPQMQTAIQLSISLAEIPSDKNGHLKLSGTDIEFLNVEQITSLNTTLTGGIKGTLNWMAPEVMFPSETTPVESNLSRDIYAFGCTILEIMTGQRPFADEPQGMVLLKVYTGERPSAPSPDILPSTLWSIIENAWKQESSQRLISDDLVSQLTAVAEDLRAKRWMQTPPQKNLFPE
ncbi:kinase-like domain-containing protein [Flagelloscypha sp. PMI_526]|nr:kinase-like domain-containing protein [Flagelloscypha sp. PMI_526]